MPIGPGSLSRIPAKLYLVKNNYSFNGSGGRSRGNRFIRRYYHVKKLKNTGFFLIIIIMFENIRIDKEKGDKRAEFIANAREVL